MPLVRVGDYLAFGKSPILRANSVKLGILKTLAGRVSFAQCLRHSSPRRSMLCIENWRRTLGERPCSFAQTDVCRAEYFTLTHR